MPVWTVCYWDLQTMRHEWTTFNFIEDVQLFLEEYKIEVKKKFPLNTLNESVSIFPPKSEIYASDVMSGKFDMIRY